MLTAEGRITIDSSPALRDRLLAILHEPVPVLTIDLEGAPYIDTSGFATMLEALKFARLNKTTLRLKLNEPQRRLGEATGLLPLFDATLEPHK